MSVVVATLAVKQGSSSRYVLIVFPFILSLCKLLSKIVRTNKAVVFFIFVCLLDLRLDAIVIFADLYGLLTPQCFLERLLPNILRSI